MTRIVFMGTPDFAVPALKALIKSDYELITVITQPDRPSGRGKKISAPPVKTVAVDAGIPVWQPKTLRSEEAVTTLAALKPDLIVVAAFGQILRINVLSLPSYGCINIHASLLPRWRGASPVTAAIRAGDTETGITLMQMDEGLDTGPIIAQRTFSILPNHTGGTLTADLAELGADLLLDTLPDWLAGSLKAQPQDDQLATMTRLLKKQDGAIEWGQSAIEIEQKVRAFSPWPGTFSVGPRGMIKILAVEPASEEVAHNNDAPSGTVFKHNRQVYVMAGDGAVRLISVQPAGKKAMPAISMLNGQPELVGGKLGGDL